MLVPLLLGSLLLQRIGSEVYEVIWAEAHNSNRKIHIPETCVPACSAR